MVADTRSPTIEPRSRICRKKAAEMMRDADARLRLNAIDCAIRGGVPANQVCQNAKREEKIFFARRPISSVVPRIDINARLVDGDPKIAQVAEFLNNFRGISFKQWNDGWRFPRAFLREPSGICEMMQRNEWHDSALTQRGQDA